MSLTGIFNTEMINRPQLRFRPHCTCLIKDISTPEFRVNRKFSQRLQSRSESNIVHTDKLLSSLTLKSYTPTSTC